MKFSYDFMIGGISAGIISYFVAVYTSIPQSIINAVLMVAISLWAVYLRRNS